MIKQAYISSCGRYRYVLGRIWNPNLPAVTWVMLNPSTADAEVDDPTIRRCIGFSKRWAYGAIKVVNLFALRATSPKELLTADDPVGPENAVMLRGLPEIGSVIVAAWGASIPETREAEVLVKLLRRKARGSGWWWCLGKTKSGEPRHPLRLSNSALLEPWPG